MIYPKKGDDGMYVVINSRRNNKEFVDYKSAAEYAKGVMLSDLALGLNTKVEIKCVERSTVFFNFPPFSKLFTKEKIPCYT